MRTEAVRDEEEAICASCAGAFQRSRHYHGLAARCSPFTRAQQARAKAQAQHHPADLGRAEKTAKQFHHHDGGNIRRAARRSRAGIQQMVCRVPRPSLAPSASGGPPWFGQATMRPANIYNASSHALRRASPRATPPTMPMSSSVTRREGRVARRFSSAPPALRDGCAPSCAMAARSSRQVRQGAFTTPSGRAPKAMTPEGNANSQPPEARAGCAGRLPATISSRATGTVRMKLPARTGDVLQRREHGRSVCRRPMRDRPPPSSTAPSGCGGDQPRRRRGRQRARQLQGRAMPIHSSAPGRSPWRIAQPMIADLHRGKTRISAHDSSPEQHARRRKTAWHRQTELPRRARSAAADRRQWPATDRQQQAERRCAGGEAKAGTRP